MGFPNVPNFPGVPQLPRSPLAVVASLAGPIVNSTLFGLFSPSWGILDDTGTPAIVPDSFLGIEVMPTSEVCDYPVEKGSFASFNKVTRPIVIELRIAKGGSTSSRSAFLTSLQNAKDGTGVFTIVTPEGTYPNMSLNAYPYRKTETEGAGMIVANCRFAEIRQSLPANYQSLVPPNAQTSSTTSTGQISPTNSQPPDQSVVNGGSIVASPSSASPLGMN